MEHLIAEHAKLISACADKLCRRFFCPQLREDLISVGNLVLLRKAADYVPEAGATLSTYLYPYLMGGMMREIEHTLYPVTLPKDVFRSEGGLWQTAFLTLDDCTDTEAPLAVPVEQQVLDGIYLDCVQAEFEKLAFKERQILGGFLGVYDFPKQTLADLAEEFQMTGNALLKAKDKALKKLSTACISGELGVWREARRALRQAQQLCGIETHIPLRKQLGMRKISRGEVAICPFIPAAVFGCNTSLHASTHCAYHFINVAVTVYYDTDIWLIVILYPAEAKNINLLFSIHGSGVTHFGFRCREARCVL